MLVTQDFFLISEIGHTITLWLLLGLSIIGLGIALERFFFLKSWETSIIALKNEIQQAIETARLDWIEKLPVQFSDLKPNPGVHLISQYSQQQPSALHKAMHSFILSKKIQFEARLNILASIGTNAPFVGLLGTIFGVMSAFYSLGAGADSAESMIMVGISKALFATAAGLIVAIPAIIAYNFLRRKTRILLDHLEYIQTGISLYTHSISETTQIHPKEDLTKEHKISDKKFSIETKSKMGF